MLFSIVIPTYQRAQAVKQAVSAVLPDVGEHGEVIVVEDRGDGARASLAAEIHQGLVRYLRNTHDVGGAAAARNMGVQAAVGRFVLFLDDDDLIAPGFLAQLITLWQGEDMDWGFGLQVVGDEIVVRRDVLGRLLKHGFLEPRLGFRQSLCAASAGMFVRRDLFQSMNGFAIGRHVDEDTDLCCRLLAAGKRPYFLDQPAVLLSREDNVERLTNSVEQEGVFRCYEATFHDNIDACKDLPFAATYLSTRAVRQALKSNNADRGDAIIARTPGVFLRLGLRLKVALDRRKKRR